MNNTNPVFLTILDGWGIAPSWGANAITQSKTPNFDMFWKNYSHAQIEASGKYVGLPGHEQGNSEVGHLNIGSGRIVYQDCSRISKSIEDQSFFKSKELFNTVNHAKKYNSNLHLIGLLSTGRIHSHTDHIYALLQFARNSNFDRVYLDLFTDGRDNLNMSAIELIEKLQNKIKQIGVGRINSLIGRYYAMDRDNHWDRTQMAYNLLTQGMGSNFESPISAVSNSYKNGETDEYIKPITISDKSNKFTKISDNDSVIFFNFRSDRARQITQAFNDDKFNNFRRQKIQNLYFTGMIPYGTELEVGKNIHSIFGPQKLDNTLAEVLSNNNLKQFHIAETEKYAHVTYFFNGGIENQFPKEDRMIINSPRVSTYDMAPKMSAEKITQEVIRRMKMYKYDFVIINYANPDMVGHTGNFHAVIEAIEFLDEQLGKLYNFVKYKKGTLIITADHGNAEELLNPQTGSTSTQHSNNPVPFILIDFSNDKKYHLRQDGVLADIAPTILELMNIEKPKEMNGRSLILKNFQS